MKNTPGCLLTLSVVTLFSFSAAQAAILNWDGEGADIALTTAENWDLNQAPADGDTLNISNGDTVTHEGDLPLGSFVNLTGNSTLQPFDTVLRLNGSTLLVGSGSTLTGGIFGFDMNNATVTFEDGAIFDSPSWENKGTNVFNFELGAALNFTDGFTTLTPGNFRIGNTYSMADATYAIDFADFTGAAGDYNITLIDYGSDFTNTTNAGWEASTESFLYDGYAGATITNADLSWDTNTDTVNLSFTVIPEPGTYALIGGLLALSYVMVRRRR
jgi:hypothetical protein